MHPDTRPLAASSLRSMTAPPHRRKISFEQLEPRQLLDGFGFSPGTTLSLPSTPDGSQSAAPLGLDDIGNTFVAGNFAGSFDFDPGPAEATLTSAGSGDAYVAKYGPS